MSFLGRNGIHRAEVIIHIRKPQGRNYINRVGSAARTLSVLEFVGEFPRILSTYAYLHV